MNESQSQNGFSAAPESPTLQVSFAIPLTRLRLTKNLRRFGERLAMGLYRT